MARVLSQELVYRSSTAAASRRHVHVLSRILTFFAFVRKTTLMHIIGKAVFPLVDLRRAGGITLTPSRRRTLYRPRFYKKHYMMKNVARQL